MMSHPVGPGDDVEAWCTKCQMDLNHRIIAVVDGKPKRVICLTCNSHHNYHPPKSAPQGGPKARAGSMTRGSRSSASSVTVAPKPSGEWKTFMKDFNESSEVKKYSAGSSYSLSDFIDHPVFGLGKVVELAGAQKITVVFEAGRKTLVCNKTSVSDE